MVDLGKRLRSLRKAKGLTQQQVADRVWVTKAMISSYELSTRAPSYEVLIKLSKLYGVTTDYLLGIEQNRSISVDNLSEGQINIVNTLIDTFRNNQDKC